MKIIGHINISSVREAEELLKSGFDNSMFEKAVVISGKADSNPTEAQKKAGNYKMGHVKVSGMDVTIENPKGSKRSGVDGSGKAWSVTMKHHYGYIKGTKGKDGDHIDVFVGDNPNSEKAFVVDQVCKEGRFDEHKVMIGFDNINQAKSAYLGNYEKGWKGLKNITEVSVKEFQEWLKNKSRKMKPFVEYKMIK